MEEVFPSCHVFINHRGPDVKKTLASLIYHTLKIHGLKVFLDKQELQAGDSLTPAIKSAICSAYVHVAIFSKRYAESPWCLNELLWMLDDNPTSSKIIPIFYDIQPWELRCVDKGAYAEAFEEHRNKGRVTNEQVDSWVSALNKVSGISGVVINTEKDDHGDHLAKIAEIVLEKVGRVPLDVCEHPVGLDQAAEHFEEEVLNPGELRGITVVGIVGLSGSGKSTLVTHLYNNKRSQFYRSCFLSDVSKNNLPSLQETLFRDLLHQNLHIQSKHQGKSLLQDRLRGLTRVLIVFDNIDNKDQIDNLLFVKDVVGNDSLILVTSRDQALLVSSKIKIYNVKLLDTKYAQELFCWHAFGHTKPLHDLQDMVKDLVIMCGGFPLALQVLAGHLQNVSDPRRWKQRLESLRKQLEQSKDVLKQIVMDSYESLDDEQKEAFLDIAHFLMGEDTDLVERVLDGLNDNGFKCLQTLRHKCLVEFGSADIIRGRAIRGESANRGIGVWRRAKGSYKIRMHDLVRDLARQIGRRELPVRLCCSNDKMISTPVCGSHSSLQQYNVRGIRRDEDHPLPVFLQRKDICGLTLLAVQNSTILRQFNGVSGDLIWFRLRQSKDSLNTSPFLRRSLSNVIPRTLLLRSLRVLEVQGVNPQDFCNLFDDREPPSQLRALEVTCTKDFGSVSTAGPSTPVPTKDFGNVSTAGPSTAFPAKDFGIGTTAGPSTAVSTRHGSVSETSVSLQPPINLGHWFQAWLGKLNLKNLVKIVLQNIQGLNTLPIKFEEVRNLRHVDLSGCSDLEVLPDSFTEELLQLQYLALRDCRKLVLQDLGRISTLEYLDFQGCSMLRELPKGTEVQKYLKHLNLVHTELRKLPQQLEQLEYLEELYIGSSELREISSSLYNLSRLTDLTLLGCTNLLLTDYSIENLIHLESFRIYNCGVIVLPEGIAWRNMKILDVQRCQTRVKQLFIGVDLGNMPLDSSQAQGSIDQGALPYRSSCLTDLIIRESDISKIHFIRDDNLFPNLETLDLSGNRLLTEIASLPGSLIRLNLMNCSKLGTLTCLSNLARLKVLDISGCDELETLNVAGLSSIEEIKGNGCWKLLTIEGLYPLERLSYFQISFNDLSMPDPISHELLVMFVFFRHVTASEESHVTILKELENCTQAQPEIKECKFTDVKLKGAILLYLITDPNCKIEVSFLDHTYTSHSSSFPYSVHILMWTKDSEVFNDFKFSKDEAIHFNIEVLNSNPLLKSQLKKGWIVEAENELEMCSLLSLLFKAIGSSSKTDGKMIQPCVMNSGLGM